MNNNLAVNKMIHSDDLSPDDLIMIRDDPSRQDAFDDVRGCR